MKFNRQFLREFWQLFKPYWTSEEKWSAYAYLALNVTCTIISVRGSVALNAVNRDFYDALQNFNKAAILNALFHFVVIVAILILSYGYALYFNGLLTMRWRRWMTKNYLQKWLHEHTHYRMQLLHNTVDNPDQRISEDLERFPIATLNVFSLFFESTLTIASFGIILWGLSGDLTIPLGSFHLTIPGYLFWGALLYAVLGTKITTWIGKRLAGLNYQQQKYDADFRYSLVRLRESGEQIAMHRGEDAEHHRFHHLFGNIFNNYLTILSLRKRLAFFTSGYNTAASLLGIVMAIPLYLQKKVQLGGMMQIAGAFGHVIGSFSMLVNAFGLFAEWRAVISRLTEFNRSMNISQESLPTQISLQEHLETDVCVENLNISLPNGQSLFTNVNLTFAQGASFLLSGKSGLGKSTLIKSIAGLWLHGEGIIKIPKNKKLYFASQKPYLPLGSFRDILNYPNTINMNDEFIYDLLRLCELEKFSHRLDEINHWAHELSLGEQQLVAFVRIFIHKPDVVFLDESTSALDETTESIVYENLRRHFPEITIVTVGHRNSLQKFHEKLIVLSREDNRSRIELVALGSTL